MRVILAVLALVAVSKALPAEPSCICTMDWRPVCGVDGKTYSNKCAADCVNVAIASNGACASTSDVIPEAKNEAEAIPCICTLEYAPVCGVDGVTYGNKCGAKCADVTVVSDGVCSSDAICACPRNFEPMCGQDGHTYSNQCEMNCAGVAMFQVGQCTAVPSAPIVKRQDACICTFIYQPVCGSDGVSYGNDCNLKCVADLGITKVSDGPCKA